jgi:hypothetical protein
MESKDLLPCSPFGSYPDQVSPHPHPISKRSVLILPSHLYLGLPSGLLPSEGISYRIVYVKQEAMKDDTKKTDVVLKQRTYGTG